MIIVFSHAHPSISKGGAEVSAYTLYKGLLALGQKAAFVAMCPEAQLAKVRFETPDEHTIAYQPARYDHYFHLAEPSQVGAMAELVQALQPSAMVFHHFLFIGINTVRRLAERFAVPSVLVLHEFLAICHHHGQMVTRPKKKLCTSAGAVHCAGCFPEHDAEEFNVRKQSFLSAMMLMTRLVSPSHFLASRFIEWGIPKRQLAVIENGLAGYVPPPPTADKPPPLRAASGLPWQRSEAAPRAVQTVFGYFGQINPFKGIDQILDALDLLPASVAGAATIRVRIHGNVVGVTEEFQKRFEDAQAKDPRIEYVGPYNNQDVHQLMQACDYIVMASKWWENSPVVIQEAYAAERPVIVPGLGGMAEKVTEGVSGHHFKPNDPEDLARVLLKCASRPGARKKMQLPRPLTAAQMAKRYLVAAGLGPTDGPHANKPGQPRPQAEGIH
ncbi:MAG TPA: glycosyltransferase [Ideonella sp.]|uniref:glycosyltransferase n=1 Tax=Ideonella sp. TaxID=1929293 RepID=UPI002CCD7E8E|nr:glycosyltransferase [Ideonella sp.]HSI50470.1 glycosyltransferase [Ideonella sp.]